MLPDLLTGLQSDMMGWLDLFTDCFQFLPMCVKERILYSIAYTGWLRVPFGHNMLPICSSSNISGVNLPPIAPWENSGINHLSQGPGTGMAQAITLPVQSSPASGVHSSDKGTRFTF